MAEHARAPAAFVGHGSPMNALELNRFTASWRELGAAAPAPRAVLCVSAHWYINATAVTAMERPRTIHDFYGFPDELFAVDYPAPGLPELAEEVSDAVSPDWVGADTDSWGLDHGTWSVLAHVYPDADVPVVQLSLDAQRPFEDHLRIGRRLDALRDTGVMVLGSGNLVHNLARADWGRPDHGEEWAHRFDDEARMLMLHDPGEVPRLADHVDRPLAVPTPDHFLPLLYVAGVAAESGEQVRTLVDGCTLGSLSMTSYVVGLDAPTRRPSQEATTSTAPRVPPGATNL